MNEHARIAHREAEPLVGAVAWEAARAALAGLASGSGIAYFGPGALVGCEGAEAIPLTPEALAFELNRRHPAPSRIRKDPWAVAQFIEQRRHRKTLALFMTEIFKTKLAPSLLHLWLAASKPPLIVDTWYDSAMREALARVSPEGADWGELQGVTRAVDADAQWWKAYNAASERVTDSLAATWRTALYKPHGAVLPAAEALVADSDYVEALTEIDIQTPIPDLVRERREGRNFVFIGCRFHDQMLRTYARQIIKRSAGGHFAFVDPSVLTTNERRFLAAEAITPIDMSLDDLTALLPSI